MRNWLYFKDQVLNILKRMFVWQVRRQRFLALNEEVRKVQDKDPGEQFGQQ
jgi:hypothetical protein